MSSVHFQRVKFNYHFGLFLYLYLITATNGSTEEITCSYKDYRDKTIKTICQLDLKSSECQKNQLQHKEDIGNPVLLLNKCTNSSCNLEVSTPFIWQARSPFLLINGYNLQSKYICLKVTFPSIKAQKDGNILIHANIQLPHGTYNLTGYLYDSYSKENIFVHSQIPDWNNPDKRSSSCRFVECRLNKYEFISNSGLLRFSFNFEDKETCDAEDDNEVILLKLLNKFEPMTEALCRRDNNTDDHAIISRTVRYRKANADTIQPLDFHNVETGCYVMRARPGCYFGFFWLNSTNIVDLNRWNTSFMFILREAQGSIQINWDWPPFPFNFTGWKLKLWTMENHPVQCNGQNPMDKKLARLKPNVTILYKNSYTFKNLSKGYYCARLGAVDPRCPEEECELRSSSTLMFDPSRSIYEQKKQMNYGIPVILLVVAGIVVGVCFSLICFHYNWASKKKALQYELVSDTAKHMGNPCVLLIWTKYSPINSPSLEPLIQVLKHVLRNYYLCQVFDYLEPLSLPKDQCRQLMSDPTSWLNNHLRKSDVKIIIVASEGAYWRQQAIKSEKDPSLLPQLQNPMDKNLFPYVLHFLQESFQLSADYSRVFQVCFPDVYGQGMELEGLVNSVRYNMPEHIKELAYRIHGFTDCSTCLTREPKNGELDEFHEAISLLKNVKENYDK